jgi:hypothetical protein
LDEFEQGKLSPEVAQALNMKNEDIAKMDADQKLEKAYEFADFVTQRTQPMFSAEHQSPIQRGSLFEQTWSMFMSFTNQVYTLMHRTAFEAQRGDLGARRRAWKAFTLALVINPVMMAMRNRLRDQIWGDDPDPLVWEMMKSWGSYLFLGRDVINSMVSKITKGTYAGYGIDTAYTRMFTLMADTLANFARGFLVSDLGKKQKRRSQAAFIDNMMQLVFTFIGLPYQNVRRTLKKLRR